jgi:hypothetical protein
METEDFARFVADQQEAGVDTEIDWAGMREEWLRDLGAFHEKIVGFLQEYINGGSITYDFTEIELAEPDIGRYLARRMDIKIGRQRVSLVPVGTVLVGCKGRVDAVGSAGRAQILLVDEMARSAADLIRIGKPPISWAWKILTNAVQRRFVDLDRESFFALLLEIANA